MQFYAINSRLVWHILIKIYYFWRLKIDLKLQ